MSNPSPKCITYQELLDLGDTPIYAFERDDICGPVEGDCTDHKTLQPSPELWRVNWLLKEVDKICVLLIGVKTGRHLQTYAIRNTTHPHLANFFSDSSFHVENRLVMRKHENPKLFVREESVTPHVPRGLFVNRNTRDAQQAWFRYICRARIRFVLNEVLTRISKEVDECFFTRNKLSVVYLKQVIDDQHWERVVEYYALQDDPVEVKRVLTGVVLQWKNDEEHVFV